MHPRAYWLGLAGAFLIALVGLAVGSTPRAVFVQVVGAILMFLGIAAGFYLFYLWGSAAPRLVREREDGEDPGNLVRWLVPSRLQEWWVLRVLEARDRGVRRWEAGKADLIAELRTAGHVPEVVVSHMTAGEGLPGWVPELRCTRCNRTYPKLEFGQRNVLTPKERCPGRADIEA